MRRYLGNYIPCLRAKADQVYDLVDRLKMMESSDLVNQISAADLSAIGVDVMIIEKVTRESTPALAVECIDAEENDDSNESTE